MSFIVGLSLKAELCLCTTHIPDLLMPYELEGQPGIVFRQKTTVDRDCVVQTPFGFTLPVELRVSSF